MNVTAIFDGMTVKIMFLSLVFFCFRMGQNITIINEYENKFIISSGHHKILTLNIIKKIVGRPRDWMTEVNTSSSQKYNFERNKFFEISF